jgi:hypothetical protein
MPARNYHVISIAAAPDVRVSLAGYFYQVDLGLEAACPHHRVDRLLQCTCSQGQNCPAVQAVRAYLVEGGEPAPDPPAGYHPYPPQVCPICGVSARPARHLNSPARGAGWVCADHGSLHYWQDQTAALRARLAARPWIFPPAGSYPGLRREDIIGGDEPNPFAFKDGYDPQALPQRRIDR